MKKRNLIVGGAAITTTLAGVGLFAFKKIRESQNKDVQTVRGRMLKLSSDGAGINQDFSLKVGKKRFFNVVSQISEGDIEIIISNPEGEVMEIINEGNSLTSLDLKEYAMKEVLVNVTGSFKGELEMKMSK